METYFKTIHTMTIIQTNNLDKTVILTGSETQFQFDQYEMGKASNIIHISDEGIITFKKIRHQELTRQANEKILKY